MKKRIASALAAGIAATLIISRALGVVSADTYPRQTGIKVDKYTFDYTLTDASNELVVKESVDVTFVAAGVDAIELDLCQFSAQPRPAQMANGFADPCAAPSGGGGRGAQPVVAAGGKGMTVTAVTAGEQSLTWQHRNDRVRIAMPRAFASGEKFSFSLSFHGVPATGILIADNKYGDRGWVSDPWPNKARNFRAVVDHPAMKAAHVTSVTAPRKYQVVSNGLLAEETDLPGDLRRTVWKQSVPISTWLMSLAVAPFAVDHFGNYHGIALSSWVFPEEHDAGVSAFAAHTQPVLEFYISHIGPYAYDKLAQVQANGVGGGMELASSIFYGYGTGGAGRQLIAHEMAHQYFGDAVTEADWDDVWLSEGFATYFALLYQEFADGHDAFVDGVRRSKTQAVNFALNNPTSTIVHNNLADISKVIANNAQIYQGGAQVLHNIRGVVGTQAFWDGIRTYYARYMNGTARTDDFRRAMEEACQQAATRCPASGKDLSWLFRQLLNRGGALQVTGTWTYDATAKQIQISLDQTQTTGVYRMPIEVRITTPGANANAAATRSTRVVELTQARQVFSLPSETEPTTVELDPDAWVFGRLALTRK